jgi:hypothetical protein
MFIWGTPCSGEEYEKWGNQGNYIPLRGVAFICKIIFE